MSWRTVVISSSAKLDYQMGYLIVRNQDVVKIHISEISILMIETTSVSLTAALLCELTKKKIKVVFCDEKRNPSSELIPYYGSHDTSMKVRKQIAWSEDIKTSVWTEIVTEKIRKQAENLERWDRTEAQMLYEYITQIEFGVATNREGHAAKVYFNALFGLDFTRTAENSINAALNYGYSLLLSTCARETALNGYITQIGLFHDNIFNQFNLASDLMEPFRPIVDNLVKTMHRNILEELWKQYKGETGNFILSDGDKELKMSQRIECIYNIFNINTNDRKIISKLYQELTYQNDALLQEESIRFKQELMEYFDKLISTVPYNLKYNFEVDLSSLMKAISVETDVECDSLLEKMLQYIKLMNQICGIDIFVIPNLKYYFSTEESIEKGNNV